MNYIIQHSLCSFTSINTCTKCITWKCLAIHLMTTLVRSYWTSFKRSLLAFPMSDCLRQAWLYIYNYFWSVTLLIFRPIIYKIWCLFLLILFYLFDLYKINVVLFDLYKINVILTLQPQVIKFISCLPIAHGRWFSSGTPGSSTTKIGCHDIAESGVKHNKSNQVKSILSIVLHCCSEVMFNSSL